MKTIKQVVKATALAVAVLVSSVGTTKAQVMDEGTNILGASIGIGSSLVGSYSGSGFSQTPGLSVSFDHGMSELGNGVWSLGGYLGYKSYTWEYPTYNGYSYKYKWNFTIIGVRGAYHFDIDNDNLDLYLGAMLSYNMFSDSYTTTDPTDDGFYRLSYNYGGVGFTGFGGIRYMLSDNFGLHAELGYGVAYLSLGASFKF